MNLLNNANMQVYAVVASHFASAARVLLAHHMARCILSQTYPIAAVHWHYSTNGADEVLSAIRDLVEKFNFVWHWTTAKQSQYEHINDALASVPDDALIWMLDDDDLVAPDLLSRQVPLMSPLSLSEKNMRDGIINDVGIHCVFADHCFLYSNDLTIGYEQALPFIEPSKRLVEQCATLSTKEFILFSIKVGATRGICISYSGFDSFVKIMAEHSRAILPREDSHPGLIYRIWKRP